MAQRVYQMYQNVGTFDAWIRGAFAAVLVVFAVVFNDQPLISLLAALGGLICIGTALTRACPLYRLLHVSTRRERSQLGHP